MDVKGEKKDHTSINGIVESSQDPERRQCRALASVMRNEGQSPGPWPALAPAPDMNYEVLGEWRVVRAMHESNDHWFPVLGH